MSEDHCLDALCCIIQGGAECGVPGGGLDVFDEQADFGAIDSVVVRCEFGEDLLAGFDVLAAVAALDGFGSLVIVCPGPFQLPMQDAGFAAAVGSLVAGAFG